MNPLQAALRQKYGTPEKALEALGLPVTLLAADEAGAHPDPAQRRSPKMAKLSATALRVHAALQALLAPKLAADAKLDLVPAVQGVTKKNLHSATTRAQIWARAKQCAKDQLAMDEAGPDDVAMRILDMIDREAPAEEPEAGPAGPAPDEGTVTDPNAAVPAAAAAKPAEEDPRAAKPDAEPEGVHEGEPDPEKLKMLAEKLGGDAELAKACYDICLGGAKDEGPAAEAEEPRTETAVDRNKAKDEEAPMLKPAMDAAIKTAVTQAKEDMRAEARSAQEARSFVRPWVGEVAPAFDTAEEILKATLESLGVKTKGVHPSAYRAILENVPRPGASKRLAMDSEPKRGGSDIAKRFPHAARIQVLG